MGLPTVSICTPTFNRRHFIPFVFECIKHQTYPATKTQWVIVDDGTDKINDIIESIRPLYQGEIIYVSLDEKITLGKKRNLINHTATGDILVYFDDDDYYPPNRVKHAVTTLLKNPTFLCAGCSEMYLFYKTLNKIIKSGPFTSFEGKRMHYTAATFAFRKELLTITKYAENTAFREESYFLQNYTIPVIELDPKQTILVLCHSQNSIDKYALLEPGKSIMRETDLVVADFIQSPHILDLIDEIHEKIRDYEQGNVKYKPDIVKQLEIRNQTHEAKLKYAEEHQKAIQQMKNRNK